MTSLLLLTPNPNLEILSSTELVSYDREETVIALLSQGLNPIKVTLEQDASRHGDQAPRMTFWFVSEDARPLEQKLLSHEPIMVDYHKVVEAREMWRNCLMIARARRRELHDQ